MKPNTFKVGDRVRFRGEKHKGTVQELTGSSVCVLWDDFKDSFVTSHHPECFIKLTPKPKPLRVEFECKWDNVNKFLIPIGGNVGTNISPFLGKRTKVTVEVIK